MMDLVFCGTPAFAVPSLRRVAEAGHRVRLVVTQPDRPRGRGLELAASPVKLAAVDLKLPIAQPESVKNDPGFKKQLEALHPAAIVVVGYGKILPAWMLVLPQHGCINLHASLLPKYRGAAPIQWAIANGETATGNTTIRLNEGLDTGDILLQHEEAVLPDDTALTLAPRLAERGAALLVETLRRLETGGLTPVQQDEDRATLAPILTKEDARMDFSQSAQQLYDRWRGFQPWPGAFTFFRGKAMNAVRMRVAENLTGLAHGEVVAEKGRLMAGCGSGSVIELLEVQIEGKKKMSAKDFINGQHPRPGEKFGMPDGVAV